jgi:hypothetical protein
VTNGGDDEAYGRHSRISSKARAKYLAAFPTADIIIRNVNVLGEAALGPAPQLTFMLQALIRLWHRSPLSCIDPLKNSPTLYSQYASLQRTDVTVSISAYYLL